VLGLCILYNPNLNPNPNPNTNPIGLVKDISLNRSVEQKKSNAKKNLLLSEKVRVWVRVRGRTTKRWIYYSANPNPIPNRVRNRKTLLSLSLLNMVISA
jgi:hypothetical protein